MQASIFRSFVRVSSFGTYIAVFQLRKLNNILPKMK